MGLIGVLFCPAARPCSCVPPPENLTMYELVKQSVDGVDSVFIGVPRLLHGDGRSKSTEDLVVFDTSTVFKGKQTQKIGVHSGVGLKWMSSCGHSFEIGKTYLVFAHRYNDDQLLVAACSFTAPVEESDVALRFLRKETPHNEDLLTPNQLLRNTQSRILGAVRRSDGGKLHDPKVYIWNDSDASYEKESWFTRPDKDGSFESYFLRPGPYRVTAVDSSYGPTRWVGCFAAKQDDVPSKLDLVAGSDFRWADIVLHEQKVFSVHGTVRGSGDVDPPFRQVEIRVTMAPNEKFPFLDFIQPKDDGTFDISRVPAGNVRLKAYVGEWVDPHWERSVQDLEVDGDVAHIEIILKRKVETEFGNPAKKRPATENNAETEAPDEDPNP